LKKKTPFRIFFFFFFFPQKKKKWWEKPPPLDKIFFLFFSKWGEKKKTLKFFFPQPHGQKNQKSEISTDPLPEGQGNWGMCFLGPGGAFGF